MDKAYLSDITGTNISESFTDKMAAKTSKRRYGTKLSKIVTISQSVYARCMLDDIGSAAVPGIKRPTAGSAAGFHLQKSSA